MREVVFVWEDETGKVRIAHPVWKDQRPGEADDQFLERVARKLPNPVATHPATLPKNRRTRDKWVLKEGKVLVVP